jgi:Asp-tRNA(Asn)/Glu-tRNA(Gln) amidotransferase A subunit family amidase
LAGEAIEAIVSPERDDDLGERGPMIDPWRLSAREALARMAAGTLDSETLVRACLQRIAAREPIVAAWAYLDPEYAIGQARALDRAPVRGPLHGIPIAIKDIADTSDMPTEYGSAAYRGARPPSDAAAVALARAAGAVVIGKTVTTEFAAWQPGKTRNPHDPTRTPGGSSSGSAAAVADFMVPLALGTQTAGSIVRPASFCGVVGLKPSFGLVPGAGTKVLAPSLDTLGGFARTVADVALLVSVLSDRPEFGAPTPAARPRIAFYRQPPWDRAQPETVEALQNAMARLAAAGADTSERPAFAPFEPLAAAQNTIMSFEAARNLAFERLYRGEAIAPRTRALLAEGATIGAPQYEEARQCGARARAAMGDLFGEADALLVPAALGEAPSIETTGDPLFSRAWTLLHLPCITLPTHRGPAGLPVGIQLVGRPGKDRDLLGVALFVEAALGDGA